MKNHCMLKHLCLIIFLLIMLPSTSSALTITATPPNINVSIGMTNAVQIYYRAFELDSLPFSATSNQARFETYDGIPLGTSNTSVSIQVVNNQGTATETILVPASVINAVRELKLTQIYYRRTFNTIDYGSDSSEVIFQVVPSSAGSFSLTRLELAFNQTPTKTAARPSSGGRITVPRNTRGLTAKAILSYNGSGTLRGQWRVDGQILHYVTQHLPAGYREVVIASPAASPFPTYATGLHRVAFEVIDPAPGFNEPIIFYYVNEEPPAPAADSLKLITPLDREHIQPAPENLPVFSWQPVPKDVIYHFQLYGLASASMPSNVSQMDVSHHKPLVAALTREASYRISIFDIPRIVPGIPYIWQVKAYDGQTAVAASLSRLVYFTDPIEQHPKTAVEEERQVPTDNNESK